MRTRAKIEFGDFQTPPALARETCALLALEGIAPDHVLEPTCGVGAFLLAAAETFPAAQLRGWDINPAHVHRTRVELAVAGASNRSRVEQQDFFTHDWKRELGAIPGHLLLLGNPPWVTNAVVSGMSGTNLPTKENFQGLRGIAARTGKANFDISEWMLIQLLHALRGRPATLAMLCKTATARKLLRHAWQNDGHVARAAVYRLDARRHFDAAVDACLLVAWMGTSGPAEAQVFAGFTAVEPEATFGLAGKDLVSDLATYRRWRHLEGLCPYQWRSGVKHDCADVMELRRLDALEYRNKLGEQVQLEPEFLFPLLKCSDLANGRTVPARALVTPQRRVGEDTASIARVAPRTWSYLQQHRHRFEARKSSIYAGKVPFALFGIGDYSFAPWKVAVSGLHRAPRFNLVGPVAGQPVLFDDTCYFLSFAQENEARVVAEILNAEPCRRFLAAMTFNDSKRPITVDLLQRLNLQALAEATGLAGAWLATRPSPAHEPRLSSGRQAELVMDPPGDYA